MPTLASTHDYSLLTKTGISSPTVRWKHAAKAVRSHITGLLRYESTGIGCVMWRERVARQAPRLFPRSGCGACTIVLVRFRCPAATAISFEGMRHLGFVKGVTWVLDPIVLMRIANFGKIRIRTRILPKSCSRHRASMILAATRVSVPEIVPPQSGAHVAIELVLSPQSRVCFGVPVCGAHCGVMVMVLGGSWHSVLCALCLRSELA